MKMSSLPIAVAVAAASVCGARTASHFSKVSPADAEYGGRGRRSRTQISLWVWNNKSIYQPGQASTVRWTLTANDDVCP